MSTVSSPMPSLADSNPRFTYREKQILLLMVNGLTNPEIAKQLGIGCETVKSALKRIYEKVGSSRRVKVAVACVRNNWLT